MSRVLPLLILLACPVAVRPSRANQPDFRLQVVPAIVYKVDDPGGSRTSSFVFEPVGGLKVRGGIKIGCTDPIEPGLERRFGIGLLAP